MNCEGSNIPCRNIGEGVCRPEAPSDSLSPMMLTANKLTTECLKQAYSINEHLFGIGEPCNDEKSASPKCFRDVLAHQLYTLEQLHDELRQIAARIGV